MQLRLILLIALAILLGINNAFAKNTHKKQIHHHKKDYMNGIASYYGSPKDNFNGKKMSNGKYFNSNYFTAAHPTLPMGTKIKVTNLYNKRTVYVEITDRMPKKTGRIIDISYKAAKYLGIVKKGISKVKLEKVNNQEFLSNKNTVLIIEKTDNGIIG